MMEFRARETRFGRRFLDALPIGRLTMDLAGVLKPSSFFARTSLLAA